MDGYVRMPCLEGRSHRWETPESRWWWDKRCLVCKGWRNDLRHHHGTLCEWESGGPCEFVREADALRAIAQERGAIAYAASMEAWRQSEQRRKDRERRWQQVIAEIETARAARQERRHQRARLREGHATLTAIRRRLSHGARGSLLLVSEPGTSSPTS
jgi:hypothetical protein